MTTRKVLSIVTLTVLVCFLTAFFVGQVHAAAAAAGKAAGGAAAGGGGNKMNDLMESKGIEGLFKSKGGPADPRAPTPFQKWLGIASIPVMIIVVKWL